MRDLVKRFLVTPLFLITPLLVLAATVDASGAPLSPGPWIVLDQSITVGNFFTGGPWTFSNTTPVVFRITDLFAVSDQYEVYDNAVLVLTTPLVPDWTSFPGAGPFTSPPFTADPDIAFNSGFFSKGTIVFPPGSHSIEIKVLHIPPISLGGPPFGDGTVAFQLTASIPTLSEWGMIAMIALLLVGGLQTLRRRSAALSRG